ncbi:MAG: response regulator [Bacteroidetes bacterium]|nr:response regulator [Bacteroidota bacterium]
MPLAQTILIAEDEPSFRLAAYAFLSSQGYKVETCDSGKSAIEALSHSKYDVIILDYRMPEMSGLNVLQWIHEQKLDTPVIMLTGVGSETIAVEALKLGAYDYIPKDNLKLHHLAVVINGVYERYLFRKDKRSQEEYKKHRESDRVTFDLFHSTLISLSHILSNSISLLSMSLDETFKPIMSSISQEEQQRMQNALTEMRQQFGVLSSGVESLLSLSNAIHNKLAGTKSYEEVQQDVSNNMSRLITEHRSAMDSDN